MNSAALRENGSKSAIFITNSFELNSLNCAQYVSVKQCSCNTDSLFNKYQWIQPCLLAAFRWSVYELEIQRMGHAI